MDLSWEKREKTPIWEIKLKEKLLPIRKSPYFSYLTKIPSDKFTKYGYSSNGVITLKLVFDTARYENHQYKRYSNINLMIRHHFLNW
jgi:hypothetical protein